MKKLIIATAVLFLSAVSSWAQTTDEIVEKYIAAYGGKEKLLQLNSVVMEGNLAIQGMEIPVKMSQLHNVGTRVDITVMGMSGYVINALTEGWMYMPFQGQTAAEAMPAEAVKESADGLDLQGLLVNYKEKGHQVEYIGKEDYEGTECLKLKVTSKNGVESTMFLDPVSYYVIKNVVKSKASGQEADVVQTYSNYKKLENGYVFAFSMSGFGGGEISFTKIEVNIPVDPTLFKPAK
ncbi:MAG: outer membrane lipoprotein-sorting protein [Chitinophagaceae bacterium]|nr:MAG: outer membrane lipoprotein-sorting protein [Chitinophagaceae bacterium]